MRQGYCYTCLAIEGGGISVGSLRAAPSLDNLRNCSESVSRLFPESFGLPEFHLGTPSLYLRAKNVP